MQSFLCISELRVPEFWMIICAELMFWTFAFQRDICHAIQSAMCWILDSCHKWISDIFLNDIFVPWVIPHGWRRIYASVQFIGSLKVSPPNSSSGNGWVVVTLSSIYKLAAASFYTHWWWHLWQHGINEKLESGSAWVLFLSTVWRLPLLQQGWGRRVGRMHVCFSTGYKILVWQFSLKQPIKTHFPLASMCSWVCE